MSTLLASPRLAFLKKDSYMTRLIIVFLLLLIFFAAAPPPASTRGCPSACAPCARSRTSSARRWTRWVLRKFTSRA